MEHKYKLLIGIVCFIIISLISGWDIAFAIFIGTIAHNVDRH